MIDEKHRHEIAEAMRRCDPKAFGWPIGLAAAIAQASDGGQDQLHELADLIDRPTCQMKSVQASSYRRCSRCGAFVRKDAVTDCTEAIHVMYCPNCGAVVADKEENNG